MSWLLSFVIGVLTAVTGCLCAGFIASLCVRWYRISSFEGGSGYFVVFTALFGLVAGFILGVVTSRFFVSTTGPWFGKASLASMGTALAIALVAGVLAWLAADLPPKMGGKDLELSVEVKFPASFTVPPPESLQNATAAVYVPGGRYQPSSRPEFSSQPSPDGTRVLSVSVPLSTSSSNKFLRVTLGKETDLLFRLALRPRPGQEDLEWSGWIESAWESDKPRPAESDRIYMRYRVLPVSPPPAGPTPEEEAARKESEEQAAFESIDPTAPITEWLPHTRYGVRGDRLAVAVRAITERETFLQEFSEILKSGTTEEVSDALRMVVHIEEPSPALVPPVTEFGQDLIRRIQRVNATRPEDDPGYEGFADVSVRFSAFMAAAHPLRARCGADFVPEMKQITALARIRKDSIVMRGDVLRVAVYYLNEWAGIPPLPDDPKP
ncbi:MAG: hypothetical protein IT186_15745 [Acidobacteria bacterium]|nr:hypothetical protein [Acidobacteriota bacterium]